MIKKKKKEGRKLNFTFVNNSNNQIIFINNIFKDDGISNRT